MSTATERLQKATQVLRSKLADERGVYYRNQKKFEVYHPNEWKVVSEAIKTIALYYHGEIVRAKHDLADWMNGHEVHGTYGDNEAVPEIHTTIDELLPMIEDAGRALAKYNSRQTDPLDASNIKAVADEKLGEVKAALELIEDLRKGLEEVCYAER